MPRVGIKIKAIQLHSKYPGKQHACPMLNKNNTKVKSSSHLLLTELWDDNITSLLSIAQALLVLLSNARQNNLDLSNDSAQ